tara:strand:+ start:5679 stop:6890 length:1212 start_codon:yes stop_codon:yes gene_type:complete
MLNLVAQQKQPYITWKGEDLTNQTTYSAVPINSFQKTESSTIFISQRKPIASKNNFKGTANPIKHWRKQLIIGDKPITGKVSVSQVMDTPGGSVYLAKKNENNDICNPNQSKSQLISNYLLNYNVNKKCYQDCKVDSNGEKVSVNNPERITRPGSTILKKNYFTTSKSYLKSRVKLFEQNQTITPRKDINYYLNSGSDSQIYIHPSDDSSGSQIYKSTFCNDLYCNENFVKVIYKPSNYSYSQPSAVSSSLRITNLQKEAINKSAKSLIKDFGSYTGNNSKYRGINSAPITIKSVYEDVGINSINKTCKNFQIRNTADSRKQLSGGTGRHTVCNYTPSYEIRKNLSGNITSRSRTPGSWAKGPVLPQINECQLILESLGQIKNTLQYYKNFQTEPKNLFPDTN